ncbi:MAG: VTC domain-containing protein, partial [Oscillospiraceae bacterium]|nr:VTC domain-containing protein [Oscillospiraceae bacterium]
SDAYMLHRKKPVDLSKYLQKQIFSELDVFMNNYHGIQPKQYISYQRSAFFGKDDPDFRLTFDRQITERRYDLSLSLPSYGAQIIAPNQRLMEVKIAGAMPMWLAQAMSDLQIYKISFSKYGTAYKRFIKNQLYEQRRTPIVRISKIIQTKNLSKIYQKGSV